MTSQSPRIYLYKITFEEVPYYYYGIKKEKYFNQKYWGSPVTHKWCWEFYTPKKQILQFFDYSDEGYIEAQKVEKRIIAPVLNDEWCLNENVGGYISLDILKKTGKKVAAKNKENKVGIFAMSDEQKVENGKKIGKLMYELKMGYHARSKEQMSEDGKKGGRIGGQKTYELGLGIHSQTPEQRSKNSRKGGSIGGRISGKQNYANGIGLSSMTKEKRQEIIAKTNSQKWMCLETGFIANPGNLTQYQRKRGIDTSKRKRIE